MNPYFVKFIQDIYKKCNIDGLTLDEEYNMWYVNGENKLVIPASDIKRYYDAYSNSHQSRNDAINRTSIYVKKNIDKYIKYWKLISK